MEIREPKFKEGDKVLEIGNPKSGVWAVQQIIEYDFTIDLYRYLLIHADGINLFASEKNLKPYIEKPKSVWDLEEREECYSLTICGNVHHGFWDGSSSSIEIRDTGGIFLTKEEAEYEIERRKVETEMLRLGGRRKFNRGKDNYFIMYTRIEGLDYVNYHSMHEQGVIYFDSELDAINAVKTIGKDRIEKYIFGVNE